EVGVAEVVVGHARAQVDLVGQRVGVTVHASVVGPVDNTVGVVVQAVAAAVEVPQELGPAGRVDRVGAEQPLLGGREPVRVGVVVTVGRVGRAVVVGVVRVVVGAVGHAVAVGVRVARVTDAVAVHIGLT